MAGKLTKNALKVIAFTAAPIIAKESSTFAVTDNPVCIIMFACLVVLAIFSIYSFTKWLRQTRKTSHGVTDTLFKTPEDAIEHFKLDIKESEVIRKLFSYESSNGWQSIIYSRQIFETAVNSLLSEEIPEKREATGNVINGIRNKLGFNRQEDNAFLAASRSIPAGQDGEISRGDITTVVRRAVVSHNDEFCIRFKFDPENNQLTNDFSNLFFTFRRPNDATYVMPLDVTSFSLKDGTIESRHTVKMARKQMRQFKRIETDMRITVKLVKTSDIKDTEVKPGEIIQARMSDLGAGGLSFCSDKNLLKEDILSVNFSIPTGSYKDVCGIIRNIVSSGSKKTGTTRKYQIQFMEPDPFMTESLLQYISSHGTF